MAKCNSLSILNCNKILRQLQSLLILYLSSQLLSHLMENFSAYVFVADINDGIILIFKSNISDGFKVFSH